MLVGVAVVVTRGTAFIAIRGSLIRLAAMAIFAVIVFRTTPG